MLGSYSRFLGRKDSSMRIEKLLKCLDILIVDMFDIILSKIALF